MKKTSHLSSGLNIPHISTQNSSPSSWNGSQIHETNCSTQHLCVPSATIRSNRYSDGNISLVVPQTSQRNSENCDKQLFDPRLIPNTVRRSLLALHRESQDNNHMQRTKEKTQSENDVHIAFIPWKIKMKSKLKRTHHHHSCQQQPQTRPHSNTFSILSLRQNSNDQERRIAEYVKMNNEYRFSTPPPPSSSSSSSSYNRPLEKKSAIRRSLRHFPQYATQSTTESEPTQTDLPMITSIDLSNNNDELAKTIIQTDVISP
ncbi:unnamed protein product [Rotaria magnacalcarata]|uniref:Uncharacterized protein n=1 Tax=Rotaria magnacalcarata TaxID=392030 RepID=A0A8S2IXE0_9BILA|nr:unnamed protein product [Rotaria magnacalcarata]